MEHVGQIKANGGKISDKSWEHHRKIWECRASRNMGNTLGQQLETMGKDRKLMRRSGLTGMKLGKILGISLPECAAEINIGMIMG